MSIGGRSKAWQPLSAPLETRVPTEESNQHIVVLLDGDGQCTRYNLGVIDTVGGNYSLTYGWPSYPYTSYSTLYVNYDRWHVGEDGMILVEGNGLWSVSGGYQSSDTQNDVNIMAWTTPNYLCTIRRTITTTATRATFRYDVTNVDPAMDYFQVGVRIMFDAMVNFYDATQFIIGGVGPDNDYHLLSGATLPDRIQAVTPAWPDDFRTCYPIFRGFDSPDPSYVMIEDWNKLYDQTWDTYGGHYSPVGDSAWAVYFGELDYIGFYNVNYIVVAPGDTLTCTTAVSLV